MWRRQEGGGDYKSRVLKICGLDISPSEYEWVDITGVCPYFFPGLNVGSKCSLANTWLQATSPTECYGDCKLQSFPTGLFVMK